MSRRLLIPRRGWLRFFLGSKDDRLLYSDGDVMVLLIASPIAPAPSLLTFNDAGDSMCRFNGGCSLGSTGHQAAAHPYATANANFQRRLQHCTASEEGARAVCCDHGSPACHARIRGLARGGFAALINPFPPKYGSDRGRSKPAPMPMTFIQGVVGLQPASVLKRTPRSLISEQLGAFP
jgi:hypothetical protein